MSVQPYYEHGGICIYHGDALAVMPTLAPVDLVLTDPPYGVRDEDWDDMDEFEFARFSMAWLAESGRLSKSLVSFCASGSKFREIVKLLYPRIRQLIWHKPPGSQYAGSSENKLWFAYEPILHCFTPSSWEVVKPKNRAVAECIREARERAGLSRGAVDMAIRGKRTGLCYRWEESACLPTAEQVAVLKGLLGLNGEFDAAMQVALIEKEDTLQKASACASECSADKGDVFSYRTITSGLHPCEKPVGLLIDLMLSVGDDTTTILDPFMGSGSTLRAAKDVGKSCIGIEREERYCEIAANRLRQEVLFA